MSDHDLANAIRKKFGTAPEEPTGHQLEAIVREVGSLRRLRADVDDAMWRDVVWRHCPSAGRYKYGALDHSDLNRILDEMLRARGLA